MTDYNEEFESQCIRSLFYLYERPGTFLGKASLRKLLDFLAGYVFAVYEFTGYHLTFERRFRQYLLEKEHLGEVSCALEELVAKGKSDEEGFEAFFHELRLFCAANNRP